MKKILTVLILGISFIAYCKLIPSMNIDKKGVIKFPNGYIQVDYKGRNWISSSNRHVVPDKGFPKETATDWTMDGMWNVKTGEHLKYLQKIVKLSNLKYLFEANTSSKEKFSPNEISLTIGLKAKHYKGNALLIDGKKIEFPANFSKIRLYGKKKAQKLSIPTTSGMLNFTGNMNLIVQDNRKWNLDEYSVRIRFSPYHGNMTKSGIKVNFELKPYTTSPIDISKQCNMGFKDDVAGDGKGGWTDQGVNDLRMMRPGKKKFLEVKFDVINPAKNEGKSCMIFKGKERPYFLDQAIIEGKQASYEAIYLLHATAWRTEDGARVGSVQVKYSDNTDEVIDVVAKRDVDDWFNGDNKPNGRNVWTGKTRNVSLYLSKFTIKNKPVDKFIFKSENKSVWMVVGLSGGDDIPLPKLFPSAIVSGKEWMPIKNDLLIKPGSALDFSKVFPKEKPAGKFGFITVKNGHFEFTGKPGKRQRFYGINLTPPYYPEYAHIDKMADYILAMGYNSARLHHYDRDVTDKSDPRCTKLDQKGMQQFDYIFARLKERGIYISTDLYSRRTIKPGAIKGIKGSISKADYKVLVAVLPDAWENWKEFATNVLEHKNYYTGIKLKDDPALFSICLVNEDNIQHNYSLSSAKVKKLFKEAYKKSGTKKDFYSYLTELGINFYKKSSAYLRNIGVKALLTSCNAHIPGMTEAREILSMRNHYDYVDNHTYWDHGKYNRKSQRWETRNNCALTERASSPRAIMGTRIFDKPFMITEFNFCYPNHYRAEGGPLIGAYCALQDYDGIFHFNLAHFPKRNYISHFDFALDPVALLAERIALLFFLRGDVIPAKNKLPVVVDFDNGSFPENYNLLGLVSQIGGIYSGAKLPKNTVFYSGVKNNIYKKKFVPVTENFVEKLLEHNLINKHNIDLKSDTFISDTNQIQLHAKAGRFQTVTAKSECFILTEGQSETGSSVSVKNIESRSVVFVGALDNTKIEKSSSLLILHLTDAQNSEAVYTDQFHTKPIRKGHLPAVIRTGEADISIKTQMQHPQVWALDLSGARIAKVPFEFKNGTLKIKLKIKNTKITQPVLSYEVINK